MRQEIDITKIDYAEYERRASELRAKALRQGVARLFEKLRHATVALEGLFHRPHRIG